MRRTITTCPLFACVAALASACVGPAGPAGPPGPGADGGFGAVGLAPSNTSVAVGATIALTATGGVTGTYTWSSSDESIATVAAGTVTGVRSGTALITAEDSGFSGLSVITVTPNGMVSFADDILPLFTGNDRWYVGGQACDATGCHTGVGSAHDLDMGTYAGILAGADGGGEPIVVAGDPEASSLRRRMRNNRMPWGISPLVPRNGPPVASVRDLLGWTDATSATDDNGLVKIIEAWIADGAPNGDFSYTPSSGPAVTRNFDTDILPLFTIGDLWAPDTEACNAAGCHNGEGGSHDLDMGTYAGIMAGADGGAEPIVIAGDVGGSPLRQRMRNNRMPWGMPTWVPRDGPNREVLTIIQWINDGVLDN